MSNAELVRRFTEEFKNHNNFDIVDEVFSENFFLRTGRRCDRSLLPHEVNRHPLPFP